MNNISILSWQNYHGRKPGSIGSSVIRADWLIAADDRFKAWKHGVGYDALILQKVYWKDLMQDFKGPKILDVCDPDWLDGKCNIAELSTMVNAITTSSEELKAEIDPYAQCPVIHVPDRINFDMLPSPKKISSARPQTLVWYGYINNARRTLDQVLESIAGMGLDLLVVANDKYEPMNDYGVNIENVLWEPGKAWQEIQRGDIVLNPRLFEAKYRFKSNNKTVIAQALGLPVATTIDELELLMDEQGRIDAMKKANIILPGYDIKKSAEQYIEILNEYGRS